MHRVNVSVPAVTTHVGPGYQSLGLALNMRTTIDMNLLPGDELIVEMRGEGEGQLSEDVYNPVVRAAIALFQRLEEAPAGLHIRCANAIPLAVRLNAHTVMIVGGLVGANILLGSPIRAPELIRLASDLTGDPAAVVAALRGGLSVCAQTPHGPVYRTIETAPMRVTIALPDTGEPTTYRHVDPPANVPLTDAVYNLGHMALLIEALREGDFNLLGVVLEDRLHEPYRRDHIPAYDVVTKAARAAGAVAIAISGGGPSLAVFAPHDHQQIADTMASTRRAAGIDCWTWS